MAKRLTLANATIAGNEAQGDSGDAGTQNCAGGTLTSGEPKVGHTLTCLLPVPPCPTVTITLSKTRGHEAKFKFTTQHATGTQCALARKQAKPRYSSCMSAKTYSGLSKDTYAFYVRAIGPGGTSAPDRDKFTIA